MTTEDMIALYAVSYFADKSCGGWFDGDEAAKKSGRRDDPLLIRNRAVGGSKVPLANGRDLVAAMIENVEDSRADVQHTRERFQRAKRDGLLNMKAYKQEDDEIQEKWLAAINVVRGDYQRAVSEMKHWQEYATMASDGTLPVLKDNAGSGVELIRQLAEAKAFEPDKRLPPERDDAVPF